MILVLVDLEERAGSVSQIKDSKGALFAIKWDSLCAYIVTYARYLYQNIFVSLNYCGNMSCCKVQAKMG